MSQHEGMRPGDGELTEPLVDPRAPWEELVEDPAAPRKLLAVLFTDIQSSTELATALGDKRWRELLEQHDAAIRAQISRFGGREVDTAGDAFFATFELPVRAVDCALESMRAVRRLGLRIRAGVHMGECVVSDGKVRGVTVHIGARVAAKARGDELLVSSTVREILSGAGLKFVDRGAQTLKGVEGRWWLSAVEPRERDNEADLPPLLEAEIAKPPLPWWKRRRVVVAAATALAVLIGAITFVTLGGGGLSSVPADSVALIDAGSLKVTSSSKVGARPVGLAPTRDGVWVTNSFDRSVSLVAADGKSVETIGGLGASPSSAAVVGNLVWVANVDGKTISRVSPDTKGEVGERIPSGNGLTDIAYGAGAIWATHSVDGTVWRLDPKQNGLRTHSVGVGPSVRGLAVTKRAVWVASEVAHTVTRIDPRSASIVAVIPVGHGPRAVAVGGGSVWVANAFDATISRIDESSGRVVATIRVGAQPRAVAFAGEKVFVANEGDATVSVIDPGSNREIRKIPLVNAPMGLAADGDRVWVSVRGGSASYRGGTLRIGTSINTADFDLINAISFDPAFAFPNFNFLVAPAQFGGLLGFKKTGGVEGAEVVPDLAEDLRPPTDGGKTYSFTLRRGLRYSDGTAVRASDVRKSIERLFVKPINYPAALYLSIVGADKCTEKACDLSQGIVTDDAARTIVFHLKQPNADLPAALALPWASVIPGKTPTGDRGFTPIPGTGPYRLASTKGDARKGGEATLERNRFFKTTGLAQPGGFADRIVVSWGQDPGFHVQAVKEGRADFTIDAEEPGVPIQQIAVEVPAQLHLFEFPSILYAVLDRGSAPFRDIRVRKALNLAIDRKAVAAALGAPLSASETCQVLPKNFNGYQPICPYTISPNDSGVWTGPDLATARRLVAESKTAGTRVTVWTQPFDEEKRLRAAEIIARTLDSLGFPTDVREVPENEDIDLIGELLSGNPEHRQVRVEGWGADYPAPSTFFLPLLTCRATIERFLAPETSFNLAGFCSPEIDRKIERALEIQGSDPKAAGDIWAEIDASILAQAPWVPLGTLRRPFLVSPRIGNVLLNPALGPLVTQMWVTETATNSPQPR